MNAGVLNICFHGIGHPKRELEPGEERYWISASFFQELMEELTALPDVRLSFDDANSSDVEVALPVLLEYGRPASFFILAGRLDRPGSLTSGNLHDLVAHGMRIGTHGMDHVPWRHLSEGAKKREMVEARKIITDVVGRPVGEAALPLGRYDRDVLSTLRRLNYDRVFSSDGRRASPKAWLQPRYSVRADDSIQSVRARILATPGPVETAKARAKGLVKRLR